MSRRRKNILICLVSLFLGALLYICFRNHTYLSILVDKAIPLASLQTYLRPYRNDFLMFYLPDFLWGLSLGCALEAINLPPKGVMPSGAIAFLCGCIWELGQHLGFVNGTADPLDALMYFTAGLVTTIVNIKEK